MRKLHICYNFTCFIWIETTLSLWEEYTQWASENKMLIRIFWPVRDGGGVEKKWNIFHELNGYCLIFPNLDRRLTQICEQELGDRCLHKAQLLQHCQLHAPFCINIYSILWHVLALCRMPISTFTHIGSCTSII